MEGQNRFENESAIKTPETREEKIEVAEKSVVEMFRNSMSRILKRIGDNPYFSDLEGRI